MNKVSFRFESLEIWHLALDFASIVCDDIEDFPKEEIFGLVQQIRKAAFSVSLNIAEGSGRKSKKDFSHFLDIAKGSIFEVVTGFFIALKRNYVSEEVHRSVYDSSMVLAKKISAFQMTLRETPNNK